MNLRNFKALGKSRRSVRRLPCSDIPLPRPAAPAFDLADPRLEDDLSLEGQSKKMRGSSFDVRCHMRSETQSLTISTSQFYFPSVHKK